MNSSNKIHEVIREIIGKWRKWLALTDYTIQAYISRTPLDSSADIRVNRKALYARIRLDGHFLLTAPSETERTIIHELLHLFLNPLRDWVRKVCPCLPEETAKIWVQEWEDREEEIVVKLSKILLDLEKGILQAKEPPKTKPRTPRSQKRVRPS